MRLVKILLLAVFAFPLYLLVLLSLVEVTKIEREFLRGDWRV